MSDMVIVRKEGLYCVPGDFHIDPWRPVDRAVITHAHADHARVGHNHYLAAAPGAGVLRARLGDIALDALDYGETVVRNGVSLSLHPAGHVLGSAQLRMEYRGEVWVASGDYKLEDDGTCAPFEAVRCDTFITESTFGMPIYRWQPQARIFAGVNAWWQQNAIAGRASVLFCYAFGKAQRILRGLDPAIGPIVCHGAVEPLNRRYREAGVALPQTLAVGDIAGKDGFAGALILAPPSAAGSPWMRRFGDYSDAFASGWMQLRGARRRRGVDRGFVLSDHADWPGLQEAIAATGAQRVIVTHGQIPIMVRWLRQNGLDAGAFDTEYGDEEEDDGAPPPASEAAPVNAGAATQSPEAPPDA
ncbi:MAG TPA: ligase-associated DNA damage response exonuclease [Herbaspirillum sp.]|jgi:putative mRNA 3-end processing factor